MIAERILVLYLTIEQVGDGFKSTMRMLGKPERFTGFDHDRAHVIQQQKRINIFQLLRGKGPSDFDAFTFESSKT